MGERKSKGWPTLNQNNAMGKWYAAVALVLVVACGDSKAGTPTVDPYNVYMANNPDPSSVLSREDAQARALLGCKMKWAPGTVDYVLHEAYEGLC